MAEDTATLDAEVDRFDPSKLRIDIQLHSPLASAGDSARRHDPDDIRRAIREGFREALVDIQIERLIPLSTPPRSKTRRWPGRLLTFVVCAGIGSLATAILSHPVSHAVVGTLSAPSGDQGLAYSPSPSVDAPGPGSQSSGAPVASVPQPAPSGPGTFGLHEQ